MSDADTFREIWCLFDADPAVSGAHTSEEWKAAVSAALDALINEPEVTVSVLPDAANAGRQTALPIKVPNLPG